MNVRTACDRNRDVYDSVAVAEVYATSFVRKGLLDAERRILALLGDWVYGKEILDIGVGGGRTAPNCMPSPRVTSGSTMPRRWSIAAVACSRLWTSGAVMPGT